MSFIVIFAESTKNSQITYLTASPFNLCLISLIIFLGEVLVNDLTITIVISFSCLTFRDNFIYFS